MIKLFRTIIVIITSVVIFILCYSVTPFICWVFSGTFKSIAQHPVHMLFGGIISLFFTIGIMDMVVDDDIKFKK